LSAGCIVSTSIAAGWRFPGRSLLLVTVLREIPDRKAAMEEIFASLTTGGILSVTEVIANPHFLRRDKVRSFAESVGFFEREFFGNWMSFTINFEKR
jgi:hypothetical protein